MQVSPRRSVFITGANKGLGLEFAYQYAAEGWRVFASCPPSADATALGRIAGAVSVHALDVTDAEAIEAVSRELGNESLDLLLLNAGLHLQKDCTLDALDPALWMDELRVNVIAAPMVARRFVPLVARSNERRIVAMSSSLGSIAMMKTGGNYAYRAGKAALNAVMRTLAADLSGQGITVAVIAPGLTRTDMGGPNALFAVDDSVTRVRRTIAALRPDQSGGFFDRDGKTLPW